MAEVVNSLFGITPESLQAQRDQALQQEAMQYAKMDPFQRATAGIYSGASRLGGALGGMLGAQDPEMMQLTQRRSLLQQAQPVNAKGWGDLGSQLMQAGDIRGAQEAYAKSQALQAAAIKQGLDTSTMASNLATAAGKQFDISPEGRGQDLAKTGKYTTESISDFIEGKGQLVAIDKFTKPQADFIAKAVELKYGEKANYGGYTPEQTANINAALLAEDLKKKATGAPRTTVTVDAKGETEFVKELGKLDAKRVSDASTVRDTAISSINSLNKLATLPATDLISGQYATGRVGVTNLLATLGLASPSDTKKLATSQEYQKTAGDVILQTLGGKLGAGFSNADREFIAGLVPQLETNPEARRNLIKFMQEKNQDIVKEANNLEAYARKNKGLSGYTPTIPMSATPTGQYSGLSDAELAARIQRAQAAQR
jgi:hypothetical protein